MDAPSRNNRWQALVTGVAGAAAGLVAMHYYWQEIAPRLREYFGPGEGEGPGTDVYPQQLDLDRPFLDARYYRRDESSTAALGRLLYTRVAGHEPQSAETRELLSYLVHWSHGLLQGGVYGVTHADHRFPDLFGGLRFATRLWFFGDEIVVPALGLQAGPTAVPPVQHANRLGAHWAYGAATAVTAKLLQAIF